eukprot:CAMPEP_0184408436 /NCGR_PEP_ID=MMETSP0738-20130409/3248_1 /TAXON_ID=385413 /ORGANISM="Thalassiosira miniscula, Strain CCMP1093" /LENGTH=74 /DNA_ID=CAMNT_0026765885 /DNA_START=133 /DNA_END=357 /DNA_ORIENTATION=-
MVGARDEREWRRRQRRQRRDYHVLSWPMRKKAVANFCVGGSGDGGEVRQRRPKIQRKSSLRVNIGWFGGGADEK